MRAMITIERLPQSTGSYLLGTDVSKMLSTIYGISAVHIENEYIDRATLSYDWTDADRNFDKIDNILLSRGMRRVP
jgi:hypothetical protein